MKFIDKINIFSRVNKKLLFLVFLIALIVSVSVNVYSFTMNKNLPSAVNRKDKYQEIEEVDYRLKAAKLMHLPQDENPQIIVFNANTPRNQAFVKDAKNGDVLLLYPKNRKVILFDPVKNLILNVGELTFSTLEDEPVEKSE